LEPIYNVLEAFGLDVILINAHHIKTVPGLKILSLFPRHKIGVKNFLFLT
jgi:hypothetical protein